MWGLGGVFDVEALDIRPHIVVIRVRGKNALKYFAKENGAHKWIRVPPTEKKDRRQTSIITVAVLPEPTKTDVVVNDSDLEWRTTKGSGPGGQHKNKTETAVQLTHKPTKIMVRADSRSQHQNKELALATLKAKLFQIEREKNVASRNALRLQQAGNGNRGQQIRTIRVHDGIVHDHRSDKKIALKNYMRGEFDGLID